MYLYLKALHIIFVVTWFAGLFYIVRLFIYHIEANDMKESERNILQNQYKIMSKRLWYMITWPSAIIVLITATFLLIENPIWLQQNWMYVKLVLVVLLYWYHYKCHLIFKDLQKDIVKYTSHQLRLWNEVATILLFSIVFLVVLKNSFNWIFGVVGIFALGILLMVLIKWYKRYREKKEGKL